MKMIARATVISVVMVALAQMLPHTAAAGEDRASVREAAKHFQRGVTLYGETDYRGALVEFNRAYAIAPSRVVLYNIGETDYQLRDYAGALTTFEKYLAEAGPNDTHRAELEYNVKELRSRVGQLTIMTVPAGAEISVDDRVVGKTPFERPVIVSIGRLKVSASAPGRPSVTRYVDVAAEDNVSVNLELSASAAAVPRLDAPTPAYVVDTPMAPGSDISTSHQTGGSSWRTAGWIATGVFAAGAVGFGLLARKESNDLKTARATSYPTTASTLDRRANRTTTFAVLTDSLAAAAIVVGGLTLYSTLGSGGESELDQRDPGNRVAGSEGDVLISDIRQQGKRDAGVFIKRARSVTTTLVTTALALLVATPACTLFVDRSAAQCQTDSDCKNFGGHPYCQTKDPTQTKGMKPCDGADDCVCVPSKLQPKDCFFGPPGPRRHGSQAFSQPVQFGVPPERPRQPEPSRTVPLVNKVGRNQP